MREIQIWFLIRKKEKEMAPHSSTLAWKIPWTEEPGRLQSMGSQRVGHDWATSLHSLHTLSLEKEMATHSSILAWRIPWTEEPALFLTRPRHWEHFSFLNNAIPNPVHTSSVLLAINRGPSYPSYTFPSHTRDSFQKFKIKEIINMHQVENKVYFRLSVTLNILV